MHRQTIGLSMTRRKNLPILKISPNLALFSPVSGLLDVNREHRSMRLRNEANVEYMSVCQHCAHGEGNGTQLQYSCLENPMDGGAWRATVHGVAESQTRLSDFTFTFYFHALEKEMATHSSVLAWRIPGTGEPGGCRLWGHTESDTTKVT